MYRKFCFQNSSSIFTFRRPLTRLKQLQRERLLLMQNSHSLLPSSFDLCFFLKFSVFRGSYKLWHFLVSAHKTHCAFYSLHPKLTLHTFEAKIVRNVRIKFLRQLLLFAALEIHLRTSTICN